MKKTEPEYYPPVENLLDLIYEHYTENNPVEKNPVAGKAAKAKEKELEEWLRGLDGMDRLVDDYIGDKIPLWEKIMDRQPFPSECNQEKDSLSSFFPSVSHLLCLYSSTVLHTCQYYAMILFCCFYCVS